MKVVYYLAMSLDGFIADTAGGVDWLDTLSIDHSSTGYEAFFAQIDGLVMGRNTYNFVHNYGEWPYGNKPTWICTTQPLDVLSNVNLQSEVTASECMMAAKSSGLSNIWLVGGGQLASSFLKQQLLTHISVSVMPILLGSGIRLVDQLDAAVSLQQQRAEPMAGFTQLEFRVVT